MSDETPKSWFQGVRERFVGMAKSIGKYLLVGLPLAAAIVGGASAIGAMELGPVGEWIGNKMGAQTLPEGAAMVGRIALIGTVINGVMGMMPHKEKECPQTGIVPNAPHAKEKSPQQVREREQHVAFGDMDIENHNTGLPTQPVKPRSLPNQLPFQR